MSPQTARVACDRCGNKIRGASRMYPYTKKYLEWTQHNIKVRRTGMGAEVCWSCWNTTPVEQRSRVTVVVSYETGGGHGEHDAIEEGLRAIIENPENPTRFIVEEMK